MSAHATRPAAAAERVALHARDDRRRAGVDRLEHLPQPPRVVDVLLVAELDRGAHPLDVGAGAEALALAREHDRARASPTSANASVSSAISVGVEGVAPLGPRQRDAEDVAVRSTRSAGHRAVQRRVARDAARSARRRRSRRSATAARRSTRTRSRRTSTSSPPAGSTACSRSARPARGSCSRSPSGGARPSCSSTAAAAASIVHCGAQTTADTVALADARGRGGRRRRSR